MANTYIVSIENSEVAAESPQNAACLAVGQAYHNQRIPSEVIVSVSGHGRYRVRNRRSFEYDRGNVDAPIDVSDLSADRIGD